MEVVDLEALPSGVGDIQPTLVRQDRGSKLVCLRIKKGAVLRRHMADVPVSILAVAGFGTLEVGERHIDLKPGILNNLEEKVPHEVRAESDLTLLVVKFPPIS